MTADPDWSRIELEIEAALVGPEAELYLRQEKFWAGVEQLAHAIRLSAQAAQPAFAAIGQLGEALRRGLEAQFLEIVLRFDEGRAPIPLKRNARRYGR